MDSPCSAAEPLTLRDFQQSLARKIQHAAQTPASGQACIAVTTGMRRWVFELTQVIEVIPLPDLSPVPYTHSWYLGLFSYRSQLTGVIDLEAFADAHEGSYSVSDRLLVLSPVSDLRCAIRVTQVNGVLLRESLRPSVPDATPAAWISEVLIDGDGKPWAAVDLAALSADPAFIAIARR